MQVPHGKLSMTPNEHAFEIVKIKSKIIRKPSCSIFTMLIWIGSAVGDLVQCDQIHMNRL